MIKPGSLVLLRHSVCLRELNGHRTAEIRVSSEFVMLVIASVRQCGDNDLFVVTHEGQIGWVFDHIVSEVIK